MGPPPDRIPRSDPTPPWHGLSLALPLRPFLDAARATEDFALCTRSEFVKTEEVAIKPELEQMLKTFFTKMDIDGDGSVTKEEAIKFWGKNFAKVRSHERGSWAACAGGEALSGGTMRGWRRGLRAAGP